MGKALWEIIWFDYVIDFKATLFALSILRRLFLLYAVYCDSQIMCKLYFVSGNVPRKRYFPSVKSGKGIGAPPVAMESSLSAVTAI